MEYKLKAFYRESEKPKVLRQEGKLPGIMYNKNVNRKLYVHMGEFDKVFRNAGVHHVITLELPDGSTVDTVVRQVQLDKRRRRPEHVDFYVLTKGQTLDMYVSLKFVGEARGVKLGGVLSTPVTDLEVRVLPRNIPDHIEVDVSELEIGDVLHASDLALPEGVELLTDPEAVVATVVPPEDVEKLEAEAAEAEELEAEPELIKRGKAEEEEEEAGE
ncbi:MAG TPA: 50S ribosomal protein L25 [Oceanithermus profundus]|uniref:Large ribosomal subunit protein bL25 n=1 Tax=Oceanithermus profundus TaxID=187137 RepID=A0A7C4V5H2_9DEIN|nr:50S ribosomal protein L25 [Oceanithermus profundus]